MLGQVSGLTTSTTTLHFALVTFPVAQWLGHIAPDKSFGSPTVAGPRRP